VQHNVARVLGVRDHCVTVEIRRMGGGFGGKESQPALFAAAAALIAVRTGRPAKLRVDRDDDMVMTASGTTSRQPGRWASMTTAN